MTIGHKSETSPAETMAALRHLGWWLRRCGLPRPDADEVGFALLFRDIGHRRVLFRGWTVEPEVIVGPHRS